MVRYRCTVKFTDTSIVQSPRLHSPGLCWWYAHGVAEHEGEGINLLRDLEGKAEAGVEGFIEGAHATYTVAPVTTD